MVFRWCLGSAPVVFRWWHAVPLNPGCLYCTTGCPDQNSTSTYISSTLARQYLEISTGQKTLQFSLDSPFWSGGNVILGVFGADDALSNLTGPFLETQLETPDAQLVPGGRSFISGITPVINASQVFVKIGARERLGDTIVFTNEEAMESTGEVPVVASGRYLRARLRIPTNVGWNLAQGIDPVLTQDGIR